MKKRWYGTLLVALLGLAAGAAAQVGGGASGGPFVLQDDEAPWIQDERAGAARPGGGPASLYGLIMDHLVLGTRITHFGLHDESASPEDPFVGYITSLSEVQNHAPTKLFAQWRFNEWVGVELTWDEVEARTRNYNSGLSDGDVLMGGPIVAVIGRLPNYSVFTPYAGAGFALFNAEFDGERYWELGYYSPEDQAAAARPNAPKNGRTRHMGIENDAGLFALLGCAWEFLPYWEADAFLRWMDIEAEATAYTSVDGTVDGTQSGTFPMAHTTIGLGVAYRF